MKKTVAWLMILSILLLCAGCNAPAQSTQPTQFLVACFRCGQEFPQGSLNTDFGMCQNCLLEAGAAYCTQCNVPGYTRDLVQGLCADCAAATATSEPETEPELKMVQCDYCGHSFREDFMLNDYCVGCYSTRLGQCLHCTVRERLPQGCHCQTCSENRYRCAGCGQHTDGSEMFLDYCLNCYRKINGVLVSCPLCGADFEPHELRQGFCPGCFGQYEYDQGDAQQTPVCYLCGREFASADNHYGGMCPGCYAEANDLCINCKIRPSDGMGPSGMECAVCYRSSNSTCPCCGYDYYNDQMVGSICISCAQDPMMGTYTAEYENVRITISCQSHCTLTYTDLTTGITLAGIPLSYYSANDGSMLGLMFYPDDLYPQHSGYVEVVLWRGDPGDYGFNAIIEGLAGTGGSYSPLTRG